MNKETGKGKSKILKKWWFWAIVVMAIGIIGVQVESRYYEYVRNNSSFVKHDSRYTIEDIKGMFLDAADEKYMDLITDENMKFYNSLLVEADIVMGRNNYYISSLRSSSHHESNESGLDDNYTIYVIPKEFLNDFIRVEKENEEKGLRNLNEYEKGFYLRRTWNMTLKRSEWMETTNNYETFVLAREYENDLSNEFKTISEQYELEMDFNLLIKMSFYHDELVEVGNTWNDLSKLLRERYGAANSMNSVKIFAPYLTSGRSVSDFIEENQSFFDKYYITHVTVCVYKDSSSNKDEIEDYYFYSWNSRSGKLEKSN